MLRLANDCRPGRGWLTRFWRSWLTHAANRHVANYSAHRETCIRLRRPAQNKSTWQKARPINDPNRHPCTECLGAEATKVKRTTGCTVARTLVPKKEVTPAERQKNTEWEAGQCLVCDEPWATAGRVISGWAARTVASVSTRIAQAGIDVMFATIIVNLTNVCPYLRLLSPCWIFGTIKCLILTHINGALTYPGVRVNLPRIWGRLTHVKRCHITYNTQNTTILVICISAYGWKWYILECLHAMIICENNTVFAKSDFWSKTR